MRVGDGPMPGDLLVVELRDPEPYDVTYINFESEPSVRAVWHLSHIQGKQPLKICFSAGPDIQQKIYNFKRFKESPASLTLSPLISGTEDCKHFHIGIFYRVITSFHSFLSGSVMFAYSFFTFDDSLSKSNRMLCNHDLHYF